ncbi:MAG: low molecular weight protein arginine phosphatase [Firmicutes bacterium]|nr:low molecular weight protein arginine phosphatase [Bacillota bacterium]
MDKRVVLLFVCSGNTCRSVMAEGLFTKVWRESGEKEVNAVASSAGIETVDGLAASAEALQVLRDEGVDLAYHRSRMITGSLVEEADYIFTMTRKQKEILLERFPESNGKAWLLSDFAGLAKKKDISDPIGQGLEQYRLTAKEIETAIRNMIAKLKQKLAREKAAQEN